jgi:FixJ family two-component response regulator
MDIDHEYDRTEKVYIVDDDDSFRVGLARVLNASGLETVSYRCAGEYLIAEREDAPGCMLLDVCMPGPSGIELWDALVEREMCPPVIFLTGCGDVPISVRAIKAGAVDYITKPVDVPRLLESVRFALSLDAARRADRLRVQEIRNRYDTLEAIERAVFNGVVTGRRNKQLAAELDKCERTIKTYRAEMMAKLNVKSLPELVSIAQLLRRANQTVERPGKPAYRIAPRCDHVDEPQAAMGM